MKLKEFYGKKVYIVDTDDNSYAGTVGDYIYADDNENEKESIIIDSIDGEILEFYQDDIKSIEIVA